MVKFTKKVKMFLCFAVIMMFSMSFTACSYGGFFDRTANNTRPPEELLPFPDTGDGIGGDDELVEDYPKSPNGEKTYDKLFNGFLYLTQNSHEEENYVFGEDATKFSFNNLVKAQISLFTQDLLTRLYAVYGGGLPIDANEDETIKKHTITTDISSASSGTSKSISSDILPSNIIVDYSESTHNSYASNHTTNKFLNCPYCYAELLAGTGSYFVLPDNLPDNSDIQLPVMLKTIKNKNAIWGGYKTKVVTHEGQDDTVEFEAEDNANLNSQKKWKIASTSTPVASFEEFYNMPVFGTSLHDYVEKNLALILAGLDENEYIVDSIDYNKTVSKIDHLGFIKIDEGLKDGEPLNEVIDEQEHIINFVLNNIIGKENIEGDVTNAPPQVTTAGSAIEYKAYNLLIPAICNKIFNNKNVEGKDLYPMLGSADLRQVGFNEIKENKKSLLADEELNDEDLEEEMGSQGNPKYTEKGDFKSIVLLPKDGAYMFSGMLCFNGDSKYNLNITLSFKYVVNGEVLMDGPCSEMVGASNGTIFVGKGNYDSEINDNSVLYDIYSSLGITEEEFVSKYRFGETKTQSLEGDGKTVIDVYNPLAIGVNPYISSGKVNGGGPAFKGQPQDNYFEISFKAVPLDDNGTPIPNFNESIAFGVGFSDIIC